MPPRARCSRHPGSSPRGRAPVAIKVETAREPPAARPGCESTGLRRMALRAYARLEEACARYLDRPAERAAIAAAGRDRFAAGRNRALVAPAGGGARRQGDQDGLWPRSGRRSSARAPSHRGRAGGDRGAGCLEGRRCPSRSYRLHALTSHEQLLALVERSAATWIFASLPLRAYINLVDAVVGRLSLNIVLSEAQTSSCVIGSTSSAGSSRPRSRRPRAVCRDRRPPAPAEKRLVIAAGPREVLDRAHAGAPEVFARRQRRDSSGAPRVLVRHESEPFAQLDVGLRRSTGRSEPAAAAPRLAAAARRRNRDHRRP